MRDTLRDFLLVVSAVAALFAAVVSWSNSREIDAVREDLTSQLNAVREGLTGQLNAVREDLTSQISTVQGSLETTSNTVIAHVNAPGLHGPAATAAR